jgi:hypothetical protein
MSRTLVIAASAVFLSMAPTLAHAHEQGAAAGAVTGAVAGAAIGGPVGTVVGAVIGGVALGAATGPSSYATDQTQGPYAPSARHTLPALPPALSHDPDTTGSVIMERTCVRDPQGMPRCRRIR